MYIILLLEIFLQIKITVVEIVSRWVSILLLHYTIHSNLFTLLQSNYMNTFLYFKTSTNTPGRFTFTLSDCTAPVPT